MPDLHAAARQKRDLRAIYYDGGFWALMVGIGESYLAPFALAAGVGQVAAGLTSTFPMLIGATLQLAAPTALRLIHSHRRWVVLSAGLQASAFLPLIAGALAGGIPLWGLYAAVAVYFGMGMATGPAWTTWVSRIVPVELRTRFFSLRQRLTQVALLIGFIAGGTALEIASQCGVHLAAFAGLFAIAALSRGVSAGLLASQSDVPIPLAAQRRVGWGELARRLRGGSDARLLLYMFAAQGASQFSGPFFTPYMLKQLELPYWQYAVLMASLYLAKVLVLTPLGRMAQRFGTITLLRIAGFGMIPAGALWTLSDSVEYLVVLQLFSGVTWAAYELATFLLFFESIRDEERTSVLTSYNLLHALAIAGGSLLGGLMLATLGKDKAAYHTVFVMSSLLRVATVFLLLRVRRPGAK
ncbi:Major Facilitator Superfamily protein [Phycisphaerae bacterium RAS1]|nr:Major Facilitator Superfamily protein [Phycisphaerae bacterium RAS1]